MSKEASKKLFPRMSQTESAVKCTGVQVTHVSYKTEELEI